MLNSGPSNCHLDNSSREGMSLSYFFMGYAYGSNLFPMGECEFFMLHWGKIFSKLLWPHFHMMP